MKTDLKPMSKSIRRSFFNNLKVKKTPLVELSLTKEGKSPETKMMISIDLKKRKTGRKSEWALLAAIVSVNVRRDILVKKKASALWQYGFCNKYKIPSLVERNFHPLITSSLLTLHCVCCGCGVVSGEW